MKTIAIVLAATVLGLAFVAAVPGGENERTVRVAITGMTCAGCGSKIETAVGAIAGARLAALNVNEGYADVTLASASVSTGAVVAAIAGAGFGAEAAGPAQKPGDAPASDAKLDDIRARLTKAKNALMQEGKYSCCIAPSCDFCAIAVNGCRCGENLAKGKPVCPECRGGWTAGHGTMPDIDPQDVKEMPAADLKKLYKSRSELIRNSKTTEGKKD